MVTVCDISFIYPDFIRYKLSNGKICYTNVHDILYGSQMYYRNGHILLSNKGNSVSKRTNNIIKDLYPSVIQETLFIPGSEYKHISRFFLSDYLIPDYNLIIELDDFNHSSERYKYSDLDRDNYIKSLGINILRIKSDKIDTIHSILLDITNNYPKQDISKIDYTGINKNDKTISKEEYFNYLSKEDTGIRNILSKFDISNTNLNICLSRREIFELSESKNIKHSGRVVDGIVNKINNYSNIKITIK